MFSEQVEREKIVEIYFGEKNKSVNLKTIENIQKKNK